MIPQELEAALSEAMQRLVDDKDIVYINIPFSASNGGEEVDFKICLTLNDTKPN